MKLANLEPAIVWDIFKQISQIPRETSHEEFIRDWIINWAKSNQISCQEDAVGNILLHVSASVTRKKDPCLLFQAHMDMVCVKEEGYPHDFRKDPLTLQQNGDWLSAKGTSLGADDGIGMALAMALLIDSSITHPKLYVLLTVAEEGPLTGAKNLTSEFIPCNHIINLDSGTLSEIPIGSVGLRMLHVQPKLPFIDGDDLPGYQITLEGLIGGHSGLKVKIPHLNALREIFKLLAALESHNIPYFIGRVEGGDLMSSIPEKTVCEIFFDQKFRSDIESQIIIWEKYLHTQKNIEPNVSITYHSIDPAPRRVLSKQDSHRLFETITSIPEGVLSYIPGYPKEVETSNQLAFLHISPQIQELGEIMRSMSETDLQAIEQRLSKIASLLNGEMEIVTSLVPWMPKRNSKLLSIAKKSFKQLQGTDPICETVHAGMESGIISQLVPHAEIISMGPTMEWIHDTKERLHIPSVNHLYQILGEILQKFHL